MNRQQSALIVGDVVETPTRTLGIGRNVGSDIVKRLMEYLTSVCQELADLDIRLQWNGRHLDYPTVYT
jgi:hypothetical protein